ncbi:hypothetical protein A8L34_27950 [Bacillus sp. FJAT-27264]|uniref:ATPase, T2SS/T4P/T4SS family n=1 Tax=Paenibacillus sp. (strain DSM 101736 / FJAT-27264) TaxID=1850362 RepID=UPI000807BB2F|nr:ATPase, T2SS/T4P/T4SS family [Bacillus sp. FJAT-27264]OBZ15882.1 hypothetical protein A8L34_27950 [Bacillus sp. FJAT-27264]
MAAETSSLIQETVREFHGWTKDPLNIPLHFKGQDNSKTDQTNNVRNRFDDVDFQIIKNAVTSHFRTKYDDNPKTEEQNRWIELRHGAVTGNVSAIEWFKKEIEDLLIRHNWLSNPFPYPKAYGDIVEAVYQETYGIGGISTWWKHPKFHESEAASVIGTRIYFEFPNDPDNDLQEICYDSLMDVERVCIQLSLRSSTGVLNKHNPSLEIDMEDGTRVTISIPPLTVEPQIVFRHFTMDRPTIQGIADKNTYPQEIVPVLDAIAAGRATSVFLGPVKSGKSTLMKAFIAKRKPSDRILVFHKNFDEIRLNKQLPNHKIMQYIITEDNIKTTFPLALRSDYEYIVVAECRSIEAEVFLKSSERGRPGAMTNLHSMIVKDIPGLIADLIIEEYPSKNYDSQFRRAAKNIHIAFVLEEMPSRSKRLNQITAFDWNEETREFSTVDIMLWDENHQTYRYSNQIPKGTLEIMRKYAPKETKRAMEVLDQLVKKQQTLQ